MDKLDIAKKIVKFVVGLSAGYVVNNVIVNNVSPEKTRHKVEALIGAAVIGSMVADAAEDWTSEKIDEYIESIRKFDAKMRARSL